jgi:hypothetical protein
MPKEFMTEDLYRGLDDAIKLLEAVREGLGSMGPGKPVPMDGDKIGPLDLPPGEGLPPLLIHKMCKVALRPGIPDLHDPPDVTGGTAPPPESR